MTKQEIFQSLVDELQTKVAARGYKMRTIRRITYTNSTRSLGSCKRISDNVAELRFSNYLVDVVDTADGFATCRETILHEFIHAMPASGRGHGAAFQVLAHRINREFGTSIGSHCSQNTVGAFVGSVSRCGGYKYIIRCTKCGQTFHRTRSCELTRHPSHYHCGRCNGSLAVERMA